ncbi:MAG TPA: metallophosphoesterase family protein [Candidatus Anaerobutyricum stercoris]|uniref:Metallophosphoesterase family protein n=1 Tax=Candidatus Anaerobutyricum stercoris TaxID=2838457 RepID=A0A9D2EJK8_9FIRM|nr:metallophosphoesterase family protein [Candidatus Anaerobutyricum stercoris]
MRKNQFRAFAGVAALSLCLGLGMAAMPATSIKAATEHWNDASETDAAASWKKYTKQWDTIKNNWENVSITPGEDETQLNFAWYSKADSRQSETAKVKIVYGKKAKNKVVTGTSELIQSGNGVSTDVAGNYYSNKVTITDLKENTEYYYQVCTGQNERGEDVWTDMQKFSTKDTDEFSFLYVGDPQIGASSGQINSDGEKMTDGLNARNDAYNWNKVLKGAVKNHPDVSFMVSAGDQVNDATSETEYAGYLSAEVLASLPVATTIGNHDSGSAQYSYHYNNPNVMADTEDATNAGTDYYYRYGNTLFIVLDTNNYNCADHENTIKKAVEENKDATWRVVTFHQDIYGSGYDHSDSDGIVLRTQLTPMFDEYDIDVVLQGHDHTYSRTYQLTSDGEEHNNDIAMNSNHENFLAENDCYEIKSDVKSGTIVNPEGTVYYEANSATGSKFYNLIPVQQNYIAERSQTWTPTYSVVSVTDDTFSVTTYDATTQEPVAGSSTYTIKKTDESQNQGQNNQNQGQNNQNQGQDQQPAVDNNNTQNQAPAATTTATALKKVKGVKATNKAGNKVKVKWNIVNGADGYQIQYTYKKGFKKKVKTVNVNKASKSSKVLKKMKVGKKVYVKVRAYQNANGQKVFGNFSKVKKLTVR